MDGKSQRLFVSIWHAVKCRDSFNRMRHERATNRGKWLGVRPVRSSVCELAAGMTSQNAVPLSNAFVMAVLRPLEHETQNMKTGKGGALVGYRGSQRAAAVATNDRNRSKSASTEGPKPAKSGSSPNSVYVPCCRHELERARVYVGGMRRAFAV